MRLLITAVIDGDPVDLAIDAEDDARVRDLATVIAGAYPRVHAAALAAAAPVGAPSLRVVGRSEESTPRLPPPDLFCDTDLLDPDEPLTHSRVRHGVVLGVGKPAPGSFAEPAGLLEVRISSGAGAGTVARLGAGEYTVGGGADCDVVLPDLGLPERCLCLLVRVDGTVELVPDAGVVGRSRPAPVRARPLEGPIVLDIHKQRVPKKPKPGSTLPDGTVTADPMGDIPLLHMDRKPVEAPQDWPVGQTLAVGTTLLDLVRVSAPDASLSPNPAGATLDYNRPPRLLPPDRRTSFGLPNEPQRPEKTPIPLLMIFIPIALGGAMLAITHSAYSLLFMLMSPMMAIGNYVSGKRSGKQRYTDQASDYAERMHKIQQDALAALVEERTARRRDFADPAEIIMTAVGPRSRLWERRQTDPDFLVARLGTADQPSDVTVSNPARESHEGDLAWTAPDVPVTVDLAEVGVTGIAGPAEERLGLARWIIGQTAVLQTPADVDMVLLTDVGGDADWNWVRWLPHVRSDAGDSELVHIGVDEESTARRVSELMAEMQQRHEALGEGSGGLGGGANKLAAFQPMLIVLDGARRLRLLPGVPELLQLGPRVRMYFVCLDADARLLPEECNAVVNAVHGDFSLSVTGRPVVEGVRPDLVSISWAEMLARTLAPIRDVSDVEAGGSLPGSSRLLSVIRLDPPSVEAVLERWTSVGRTTEAVIGESADGAFAIDMVRDGPHGLVAGTTGAGKSELLQTIIASLAINNRPDEMNYVLIDYKGGAAFKDCNNLPHTVGMVTDLDGHLTTRALESLGAELRRREHQLAAADAKDIEDYLAAKGPDDEPMPRLLIVIDEFAALVAELPDFVTGLVDIARRGRSLGVHLILATQRPAGVVSAEIKSNTNLRIALRVTDSGDSSDVIEAPDAAQIAKATPGRAYARLGHSSLIPFQSSRVGGRPRGEDAPADINLRQVAFASLGTPEERRAAAEEDISIPTDLAAFVTSAREASARSGIVAPPSPWLPAMPEIVTLDQLLEEFPAAVPSEDRLVLPFGMVDVPSEQRRDVAGYDLARGGHLAVVAAPRAGRSTLLRALAGAVARFTSPADVQVYGVDCGNNALLPLVGLPHVGAVVTRDQRDRMDRLVSRLQAVITERQQSLALGGYADVTEQRASVAPEERLPYLLVLFDRWEGFFQAYDEIDGGRLVAAWQQILQEGAAVGIKVVVTGDRTLTLGRMSTLIDDKLMMRMVDMTDFGTIGMSSKQVPSSLSEGRGFRAEGLRETQVALLAEDPAGTAQVGALQEIGREAETRYADLPRERRPFRLDVLPVQIGLAEATALQERPLGDSELVLAVGGDTLGLRTLDAFEHGPALLVTGPRRSGRSTVLRTMATFALTSGWKVVVVTPRLSPLRDLCATSPDVYGPFDDSSDQTEVTALFAELRDESGPVLTLVDDVELIGADGWLPELLGDHIDLLRDSGSVLAAAGSPADMGGLYRGPTVALKRSGSGLMLAPASTSDPDMFGARMARSLIGLPMPPGGGYLMRTGSAERVQVIWPE
ncbi:cell division-like protein [Nocardioides mangrovicus]|uniref:Cell division-like protein n=1 Tax=Nocardioides mangrovicus TaxID=2478913 RepID=A0A3L8NYL0_9ACTN|nr:FtsK/SpoIIIE domain-containing protein [Nocardioides mangrovicus]RLV47851.1 cell division-like protein [Nocardioides mangrovicus]